MYELIQLSPSCYYIQSPANIGLVRLEENRVCLIDSGSDKDAGRKVRQLLDERGWQLAAIYITHAHADHIGGCSYLQKQTGCPVYAPGAELAFTQYPYLEPTVLYGGYPFRELRHKFLMAQGCQAQLLTQQALPQGWQMIPLPGHFLDMVGFRTPENVVYLADCLASRQTLEKYPVTFLYDPGAYCKTLESLSALEADWFVPAHAPATQDIRPLAQVNLEVFHQTTQTLLALCREPVTLEGAIQALFQKCGMQMNFQQYVLTGSTLRSCFAWLKDTGKVRAWFEDNLLYWQAV